MEYPVLGVVDKRGEQTVIWHVQTDPGAPAKLSGSWIADDESLLDATYPIEVGSDAIERIADAVDADVKGLRAAAAAAKEANPAIKLPRFPALERPDLETIKGTFHGEEIARDAWAHAVALAEITDYWHSLETARRLRKYLVDGYGDEIRPLPLGQDDAA